MWTKVVAGRLRSDSKYANTLVYNNFPWCNPINRSKGKIKKTAQSILKAIALYLNSSLAYLYNELTNTKELRKVHQENDKAIWSLIV